MAFVGDTYRINSDAFASISLYKGTNSAYTFKFVNENGSNVNMQAYSVFDMSAYRDSINTNVMFSATNVSAFDGRVEVFYANTATANANLATSAYLFEFKADNSVLISGVIELK